MSGGLASPGLSFDGQGLPYSADYGDYYFSRAGGLAESRYVFLRANDLPARWQSKNPFVIGETGFGTGLNLLATWQCWDKQPGQCRRLHYVSVEKHPLNRSQLQQSLALWPELQSYAQRLLSVYPELVPGFHRVQLTQNFTLTLLFGDVTAMLALLQGQIDAWYMDGFAPARNPAMWQPEVFRLLAQNSAPEATLSTFTAAGLVRRGLAEAGFEVTKIAGFGNKREMLKAVLKNPTERPKPQTPWLALPTPPSAQQHALIIGAGLAGCATAAALARHGWQVTVLERATGPAQGASGNPVGLVMPRLNATFDLGNAFYLQGFLHTLRELEYLQAQGHFLRWQACGVVQCAADAADRIRLERGLQTYALPRSVAELLEASQISALADVHVAQDGVWFPTGGCLQAASLCRAWLAQSGIETRYVTPALRVQQADGYWQVFDRSGLLSQSPVLILAAGLATAQLAPLDWLPLWAYRGQTSALQSTASSKNLRVALCGPVYLTPPIESAIESTNNDEHVIGATFQAYDRDSATRPEDNEENLQRLQQWLPDLFSASDPARSLFANIRAATPGRLPAVGPVLNATAFNADYAEIFRHGKTARYFPPVSHLPGLYVLTGLGSHGIISAPLAAEYLASLISNEPLPLPRSIIDALNPARFLVQKLKQSQ